MSRNIFEVPMHRAERDDEAEWPFMDVSMQEDEELCESEGEYRRKDELTFLEDEGMLSTEEEGELYGLREFPNNLHGQDLRKKEHLQLLSKVEEADLASLRRERMTGRYQVLELLSRMAGRGLSDPRVRFDADDDIFSKDFSGRRQYEFFNDMTERRELFEFSKAVAEYLRSENIPNLVILDRSSRPLYIGVREYLRSMYPDEPLPNIYFLNPKGFKNREDLTRDEIMGIMMDSAFKEDVVEGPNTIRSQGEILDEFHETYKRLLDDKDKPVLMFDTCIHSGDSVRYIKKAFDEAGFSDLRIGAINPADPDSGIRTDFYVTTREAEKGCYPFDQDRIIEKTFNHVYSRATDNQERRQQSIRLRREIQMIIREKIREAQDSTAQKDESD
ncbi:MAG: hypothetical protein HGA31_04455 [Candidatus Moranbacteria bacterium]|nr:hypothetical protein [Candidatus Moranbacteria bacterium]